MELVIGREYYVKKIVKGYYPTIHVGDPIEIQSVSGRGKNKNYKVYNHGDGHYTSDMILSQEELLYLFDMD